MALNSEENEYKKALDYINDCTKNLAEAADKNFAKLSKLGITVEDVEEISRNSKLDETIASAQKHNMMDALLSHSNIAPAVYDTLFQSIHEKTLKEKFRRLNFEILERIRILRQFHSLLEKKLEESKNKAADNYQNETNFDNILLEYEEQLEQLKEQIEIPENCNLKGIFQEMKELEDRVAQINNKIEGIKKQLEKYGDLPPDILLAKSQLADADQKCRDLSRKITSSLK